MFVEQSYGPNRSTPQDIYICVRINNSYTHRECSWSNHITVQFTTGNTVMRFIVPQTLHPISRCTVVRGASMQHAGESGPTMVSLMCLTRCQKSETRHEANIVFYFSRGLWRTSRTSYVEVGATHWWINYTALYEIEFVVIYVPGYVPHCYYRGPLCFTLTQYATWPLLHSPSHATKIFQVRKKYL